MPHRNVSEVIFNEQTLEKRTAAPRKNRRVQLQDSLFLALQGSEGKNGEYAKFLSRLSSLLSSGSTTAQALIAASNEASPELREICVAASVTAAMGLPLSDALMPHRSRLPEILIPTLQAGERNGNVLGAIERLTVTFNKSIHVNHRFGTSALSLPTLFGLEGSAWNASSRSSLKAVLKFASAPKYIVPILGLSFRSAAGARWARSFAANWENGIPVSQTLELSAISVRNRSYASAMMMAAARTRNGWSLKDSLAHVEWLPPNLVNYIETGELTGNFETCLNQLAVQMEDDAKVFMGKAVFLATYGVLFGIAFVGAVIAFVMAWMIVAEFERTHPEYAKPFREALDRYRTTGE